MCFACGRVPRRGLRASDVMVIAAMSVCICCMACLYSSRLSCVLVLMLGAKSCWCFVMMLYFMSHIVDYIAVVRQTVICNPFHNYA